MKRILNIVGLLIGCMMMIGVVYASSLNVSENEGEGSCKIILTEPGDRQIVGSGSSFKWEPLSSTSNYTLCISEDIDFPQDSIEGTTTTNSFTELDSLKLEAGRVYYWKVTSSSCSSDNRSFMVGYEVDVAVLDENSEIIEGMIVKFTSLMDDFSSSSEVIQGKARIYGYGLGYITIEDLGINEPVFVTRDETFLFLKEREKEDLNLTVTDEKEKRGIESVSVFLDGNFMGQTDDQGNLEISEVAEGLHTLYYVKEHYQVGSENIDTSQDKPYKYALSRSNSYWLEKLLQYIPIVFCVILLIFLLRVKRESEKTNNALRALVKEQESMITESRKEVRTIREYVTKILERT